MATITKPRSSEGKNSYLVTVRRKGLRSAICKTFSRLGDARVWAQRTETDLERGVLAVGSLLHSVGEVLDFYEKEPLQRLRSAYDRKLHLKWWRGQLGSMKLGHLSDAVVQDRLRE